MAADNAMEAVNPGKTRKCTDILCLVFFGLFWVGMLYVVSVGFTRGDPDRLIYALDYKFDQCSKDNSAEARGLDSLVVDVPDPNDPDAPPETILLGGRDLTAAPFFYVVGPGRPRFPGKNYVGVCTESCPGEGAEQMLYKPEDWVCTGKYYGVDNRPSLDSKVPTIEEFSEKGVKKFLNEFQKWKDSGAPNKFEAQFKYLRSFFLIKDKAPCPPDADPDSEDCSVCFPVYPSIRYGDSACLPDPEWIQENGEMVAEVFQGAYSMSFIQESASQIFGDSGAVTMRVLADAYAAMPVILGCVAFAVVLGFVWAYLLRLFIKPMVFLTIIGVLVGMVLGVYTLYTKSFEMRASHLYGFDDTFTVYADVTMAFFAFTAASLALYVVFLICFWSRIFLAVGVIIEAAKAMQRMPSMLLVPVVPALITFGLFCYLMFGAFYIASAGELRIDGNGFAAIDYDNNLKGALAYHFFGVIWTSVFFNHVGWAIIAGSVTQWYFTKNKADDLGAAPVLASAKRVLRYHMGSVAFGSLIVAVIKYIRYMMYILKRYADPDNKCYGKFIACIWCCIDCCLRCFERLLEFISKNAYIIILIESESFCTSARHAFGYLVSNLAGLAMVQTLGDGFLFLGKLFVAVMSAGLCAVILTSAPQFNFSTTSIVLPCLIVFAVSYVIGSMFMGIFEMAIDTIFMCYAIDEDKQLGYADGALKSFVKENAKEDAGKKDDKIKPAEPAEA